MCNIGYPSETHLKPESRYISFAHNLLISYPVIFAQSMTVILTCSVQNFQRDWTIATEVKDEQGFAIFQSKINFGWISCIAQQPSRAWWWMQDSSGSGKIWFSLKRQPISHLEYKSSSGFNIDTIFLGTVCFWCIVVNFLSITH